MLFILFLLQVKDNHCLASFRRTLWPSNIQYINPDQVRMSIIPMYIRSDLDDYTPRIYGHKSMDLMAMDLTSLDIRFLSLKSQGPKAQGNLGT